MNWLLMLFMIMLIVVNYYYIDQFTRVQRDIKIIKAAVAKKTP